jgi:hypothetical protein
MRVAADGVRKRAMHVTGVVVVFGDCEDLNSF